MIQTIRESLRNPYMFALATAVVARLTQWAGSLAFLKNTDWHYNADLFFTNLANMELRSTFIGINVLVIAAIIAMSFFYCAYIKQPGSPSRAGLIALAASIFLVVLHIIASLLLTSTPLNSFNATELGTSMMRNFVIIVGGFYIGEWLYSIYE